MWPVTCCLCAHVAGHVLPVRARRSSPWRAARAARRHDAVHARLAGTLDGPGRDGRSDGHHGQGGLAAAHLVQLL
eukprot:2134680-Prymnesium_polylepis.1